MTQHVIAIRGRMRILEGCNAPGAHSISARGGPRGPTVREQAPGRPPAAYPVDLQGMMPLRSAWLLILCLACGARRPGFDGIARAIERGVAPKTTSVLVMRGDAIVYERYFDGATAATLHNTRSATKPLTALAIGIAIERGALPGVDAPAFAYLADLQPFAAAGPLKDAITIADLLTMSSALDCNDDDERSPGNEENMYPRPVWARWAVDIPV